MIKLKVNSKSVTVAAEPETPLLWAIREHLQLTGTKYGCGAGHCGACIVHVDGRAVKSCQISLSRAEQCLRANQRYRSLAVESFWVACGW